MGIELMVVMCIGSRDIKKRKEPRKEAKAKKPKPVKKAKARNAPKMATRALSFVQTPSFRLHSL